MATKAIPYQTKVNSDLSRIDNERLISHIMKISSMINSTLDLDTMLESILNSAKVILKAENSSLMLLDNKTNELYFNMTSGSESILLEQIRVPMGHGIAGLVAQARRSLIVNDAQNDPRLMKSVDKKTNFITKNILASPMIFQERLIGVIEVINSIGRTTFSEQDLKLLSTFCDQAALAIQTREFVDSLKKMNTELNQKLSNLSTLHEIGKVLISTLDQKAFFDSVVRVLSEELRAKYAAIIVSDQKQDRFKVMSYVGDNRLFNTISIGEIINSQGTFSKKHILNPLQQGDKNYGHIYLSEKEDGTEFTKDDKELLNTIANQITKGAQSFELLQEELKIKSYESELKITSSFQKSLLPTGNLDPSHYDMGFLSKPAKMMGGDFYDFFQVHKKDSVFLIADVSGKSLPAALFMAVSNSIIRTIGKLKSLSTSEIVGKANDLTYENSKSGMFVTLFYSVYDPHKHKLTYSSAGHNEQLVYRVKEKNFEDLQCKGMPLGIVPTNDVHSCFGIKHTYVNPGDILIYYTDGIIEALNPDGEEFGLERVKEIIMENYFLAADQIAQRIYREIERFAAGTEQFDDITIMIVKILN